MTGIWRLRATVLTVLGVVAVHQGRFLFASEAHEHELAPVHGYLPWMTAAAAALLFVLMVQLVASLERPDRGALRLPSGWVLWGVATTALLSAFVAQETVETALVHGHLPVFAELMAGSGWVAAPLSLVVGGLVALLLRGAAKVVRWVCSGRRPQRRRRLPLVVVVAEVRCAPRGSLIARRLAGRAPPVLS
ncbi:MAG TPA: hypothetical protein VFR97_13165 [Capillimicrobium sp.]|nr:hypothetical protein [Capillimicrobium sp.]